MNNISEKAIKNGCIDNATLSFWDIVVHVAIILQECPGSTIEDRV